MSRFFAIALVAFFFPLGSSLRAQKKNACVNRTITLTVAPLSERNRITVFNTEFRGAYGRKSILVKSITFDRGPRRVVILMDLSGSMAGRVSGDWNVLFDTARDLISQMPPTARIGFASFTGSLQPIISPTADHQSVLDSVERMRSSQSSVELKNGDTAMRDAIHETIAMFGEPDFGDAIYIISDGYDNRSKISAGTVVKELDAAGIRLFAFEVIGTNLTIQGSTLGNGPSALQDIVEDTGGISVGLTRSSDRGTSDATLRALTLTPEDLHKQLAFQYRQILEMYRLDVQLPEYLSKPQNWKLIWVGPDKSVQKNYVLLYPKFLGPCH